MARNFQELLYKMSPERQERVRENARKMEALIALHELRRQGKTSRNQAGENERRHPSKVVRPS